MENLTNGTGRSIGSLTAIVLSIGFSLSAISEPVAIPRVGQAPTIDGHVQDQEWNAAARVILSIETKPGENIDPAVSTEALMMEDGEFLFVAFIASDPDTSKIRAYYSDHDQIGGHDAVGIVLDTFNDERQAFEFFVNPLGVQRDVINDDINKRQDDAWDALWESAGQINGTNYTVELAIPFNQLRFKDDSDKQTWGLDLVRLYPRDKFTRIGTNALDRNVSCYLCQLSKAEGFEDLPSSLNLVVTPTLTGNVTETRDPPDQPDWQRDDSDAEAGLDVRWGINQSLYFNATINPDFSQVEADNPQLDVNTTFSLFFPEKRTFFLDGASYFNSRLNIVHTRNIAEPDYGVKLTGKNNGHSYGVLAARDNVTSFVVPGNQGSDLATLDDTQSDVFIGRYRYDIGDNYTLGIVATDRRADDYNNSVFGLDGVFQFTDSDRVEFQGLHSRSENPLSLQDPDELNLPADQDGNAFITQYRHEDRRWHWFGKYEEFDKDFRADLGFITRVDVNKRELGGGHTWNLDDFAFSRIRTGGNWDKSYDQDGVELEEEWEGFIAFNDGPKQSFIEMGGGVRERLFDSLYFDEQFAFIVAGMRPTPNLFTFIFAEDAKAIDFANTRRGDLQTYEIEVDYRLGRHLSLEAELRHQRFNLNAGVLFKANITDLRATYQFNNRSFIRLTTQYVDVDRNLNLYLDPNDLSSTNKDIATQLLYSYKINAQSRFFVGYSDAGFQDDQFDAIKKTARTFFVKASYAWQQ